MELDRLVGEQHRETVRRVLDAVSGLAAVGMLGGIGWVWVDSRGGGAVLAFCSFVSYLVARAVKWSV